MEETTPGEERADARASLALAEEAPTIVSDLEVTTPREAGQALASSAPVGDTEASEEPTVVQDAVRVPDDAVAPADGAAKRAAPVPHLAAGVELIGEFEDSGFKDPPYIARRDDGQVVQMPQMLFALAEQIDGTADLEEIATRFSHAIERTVPAADVQMLIDKQLVPLGIVATGPEQESVQLGKVDPLLALKFRAAVVPDGAVRSLTAIFRPLFFGPLMLALVAAFVGLDGWLFFVHGISQSLRHVLYQPALMLMLIGGVVLATAFHEIGHATACRYGGAKPGVMGVGIYIVWPAFYTDITDAYRLGKWGRLRTDVGGMYFNAIFALLVGAAYAVTSFEPLLLLIVLQTFAIIQQALPLLRLDGYYILSDLTGVPDIYLRIRAVLASLIPGRPTDPKVAELRPSVRVLVTVYVLAMVVFLAVAALGMVINLPRLLATGYDSSALHWSAVGPDFGHGRALKGVLDVVEMLFLILPAAGLLFTAVRIGRRGGSGAIRWSAGHPGRQTLLAAAGTGLVLLAAFSWWPNGEYRPIQPGERGTVQGLVSQIRALPTGRPSLTVQRQRQLGGAPTQVQRQHLSAKSQGARSSSSSSSQAASGQSQKSQTISSSASTTSSGTATTNPAAASATTTATQSTTTTTTTTTTTSTTSTTTTSTGTSPSSASTATTLP